MSDIDVNDLVDILKKKLLDYKVKPTLIETARGTAYFLELKQASLRITLGIKWIGYELEVSKKVVNKNIGMSIDTDNYELGGKNKKISLEIFDECLATFDALMTKKILTGFKQGKPILAIPNAAGGYKVTVFGRFISKSYECSQKDIATHGHYSS